jgi:hypothetical protein
LNDPLWAASSLRRDSQPMESMRKTQIEVEAQGLIDRDSAFDAHGLRG